MIDLRMAGGFGLARAHGCSAWNVDHGSGPATPIASWSERHPLAASFAARVPSFQGAGSKTGTLVQPGSGGHARSTGRAAGSFLELWLGAFPGSAGTVPASVPGACRGVQKWRISKTRRRRKSRSKCDENR